MQDKLFPYKNKQRLKKLEEQEYKLFLKIERNGSVFSTSA